MDKVAWVVFFITLFLGYSFLVGNYILRIFSPQSKKGIAKTVICGSVFFGIVPLANTFLGAYITFDQAFALLVVAGIGVAALLIPIFLPDTY